ncbi:MAG TPA: DUF1080 domain-containing protein [Tepidisphaeraceae bacterium]|jgi:hypothetical protein|nr:DUF1080 domain-containing protein [Tepidisphaeraceae bacterium]
MESERTHTNNDGHALPRRRLGRPDLVLFLAGALTAACLISPGARGDAPPAEKPAAKTPDKKPAEPQWQSLFDGKTLGKWKVSDFAGHGEPTVEDGTLRLPFGEQLTGVTYSGEIPKMNYEVELEAQKLDGADFFCGLTFPVDDSFASFIVGGWGGSVVGISSFDGKDAAHNDTRSSHRFDSGKWYKIRLRVLPDKLQAWINEEKVVDVTTTGKKISTRREIDAGKPFGLSSYQTSAAMRNIRIRTLATDEAPAK